MNVTATNKQSSDLSSEIIRCDLNPLAPSFTFHCVAASFTLHQTSYNWIHLLPCFYKNQTLLANPVFAAILNQRLNNTEWTAELLANFLYNGPPEDRPAGMPPYDWRDAYNSTTQILKLLSNFLGVCDSLVWNVQQLRDPDCVWPDLNFGIRLRKKRKTKVLFDIYKNIILTAEEIGTFFWPVVGYSFWASRFCVIYLIHPILPVRLGNKNKQGLRDLFEVLKQKFGPLKSG